MPRGYNELDSAVIQKRLITPLENDPFYNSVVWNLTGGGISASTNILDISSRLTPTTVNGTTQISNTQSALGGTTSIFFNNSTSNYITAPANNADFALGTGDFTVEGWVYQNTVSQYSTFFEVNGHLSPNGIIFILGAAGMQIYSGGFFGSTPALTTNAWTYYAYSRNSNTMRQFINGTQVSSYPFTNNLNNVTLAPVVGQSRAFPSSPSYTMNGYMNDIRITKGVGRYTAAFTPPTRYSAMINNGVNAWAVGRQTSQTQINSPYLNRPPLIGD
jgi:hypothetical protein